MMRLAAFLLCFPLIAQTSFVTAFPPTSLRNDFTGSVGTAFKVGAQPVTLTAVGRMCVAGNSGMHEVQITDPTMPGNLVNTTNVFVKMAGCVAGQYVYVPLATTLNANATYYLTTFENVGADRWYDQGPVNTTNVATVSTSIYNAGGAWVPSAANSTYGPVSFLYGSAPPPAPAPITAVTVALGANQCTLTPQTPSAGSVQVVCTAGTATLYTSTQSITTSSASGSWVFPNGTISWLLSPATGTAVNYQITNGSTPKSGVF